MAGIVSINGSYNLNTKRVMGKLSFDIGESFLGRVINTKENSNEILIKMMDGWQFPAKIQKPLMDNFKGVIRFEVQGFENGEIILRALPNENKITKEDLSSLESTLIDENINADEDDIKLFKSMINHNMELTKENIEKVKAFVELKKMVTIKDGKDQKFIDLYLKSKGIDSSSVEGKNTIKTLKDFFAKIEGVSVEEMLTMMENGIDLDPDSIESFQRVFKNFGSIYKEVLSLKSNKSSEENIPANIVKDEINSKLNEVKDILSKVLNNKGEENIIPKEIMKDFKIFNSVSDKYYYYDMPLKMMNNDYDCRIMIKDDRKRQKSIDSKNIKLVISLKTVNIGVVDAYISVKEKNMNMDFKCEGAFTEILKSSKDQLINKLKGNGFNVWINVGVKEKEADLVNCGDFFNDNNLKSINILV